MVGSATEWIYRPTAAIWLKRIGSAVRTRRTVWKNYRRWPPAVVASRGERAAYCDHSPSNARLPSVFGAKRRFPAEFARIAEAILPVRVSVFLVCRVVPTAGKHYIRSYPQAIVSRSRFRSRQHTMRTTAFRKRATNPCASTLAIFVLTMAAAVISYAGPQAAGTPSATPTSGDSNAQFIAAALSPLWSATEVREPFFFIQGTHGQRPKGWLLFKPKEIVSVRSATQEKTFEAGKDYKVDLATGSIELPEGSKIPVTTVDHLYPLMTSNLPKIGRQGGDGKHGIFFGGAAEYHQLQVEVTYRCEPGQWKRPTPKYAGDSLPKTEAKLRAKEPVTVMLCGDSISAGANASLMTKAPPGCPAYGELTCLALEKRFGSKVKFINHAVGGWTSGNGLDQAKKDHIGKAKPDLVIIAFGMNDVFQRNKDVYQANIRHIMETVRGDAPDAEFILVASMLGNAEWGMPMEQFPLYRDALAELCGPGVALADMTSMWESLLKRKTFYDLTGNGVNHPNDFGHCVYAQTLCALLIEPAK
jgi:lysophospholipase L1-like esterase